jgi:hypothetical protein
MSKEESKEISKNYLQKLKVFCEYLEYLSFDKYQKFLADYNTDSLVQATYYLSYLRDKIPNSVINNNTTEQKLMDFLKQNDGILEKIELNYLLQDHYFKELFVRFIKVYLLTSFSDKEEYLPHLSKVDELYAKINHLEENKREMQNVFSYENANKLRETLLSDIEKAFSNPSGMENKIKKLWNKNRKETGKGKGFNKLRKRWHTFIGQLIAVGFNKAADRFNEAEETTEEIRSAIKDFISLFKIQKNKFIQKVKIESIIQLAEIIPTTNFLFYIIQIKENYFRERNHYYLVFSLVQLIFSLKNLSKHKCDDAVGKLAKFRTNVLRFRRDNNQPAKEIYYKVECKLFICQKDYFNARHSFSKLDSLKIRNCEQWELLKNSLQYLEKSIKTSSTDLFELQKFHYDFMDLEVYKIEHLRIIFIHGSLLDVRDFKPLSDNHISGDIKKIVLVNQDIHQMGDSSILSAVFVVFCKKATDSGKEVIIIPGDYLEKMKDYKFNSLCKLYDSIYDLLADEGLMR